MNNLRKNIFTACALTSCAIAVANENVNIAQNEISNIGEMFENGRMSGEIRSMYAGYNKKQAGENDIYATALGGYLKYELATLKGLSAAAAFSISHDINFATGEEDLKQNPELSSSEGKYTVLSEAYLNYSYDSFNFRAGRQLIDTPLADSDDIRMIANTFEAYIATYQVSNFNFIAGNLQKWQGVDTGLDDEWIKTGEDGTWFGGIMYSDGIIEANAWYYNITKLTNAAYFDIALNYEIDSDIFISGAFQYLNEKEISSSGTKADIYGASAEFSAHGLILGAAYNKSEKKANKESFSGFGGGTLFTNMDTMILDEITYNDKAEALVGSIGYEINNLMFMYAYGDFDSNKAHIVEQNIGIEYSLIKDSCSLRAIFVNQKDKENVLKTENDWDRFELMAAYRF